MNIWEDINKIPSVRIYALRHLVKIAKKYPELAKEITFLLDPEKLHNLSPAVKHSISKLTKEYR